MASFRSLWVVFVFALSFAVQAAEVPSTLHFVGAGIGGLDYKADLRAGTVTGAIHRSGDHPVQLKGSRGLWSGTLGAGTVQTLPIRREGIYEFVEIRTSEGTFRYASWKSLLGRKYRLLRGAPSAEGASLEAGGSLLLDSSTQSFELHRDPTHPNHFEGTSVYDLIELETDRAFLDVEGALDPSALSTSDPSLFVLLYILPFHLRTRR